MLSEFRRRNNTVELTRNILGVYGIYSLNTDDMKKVTTNLEMTYEQVILFE